MTAGLLIGTFCSRTASDGMAAASKWWKVFFRTKTPCCLRLLTTWAIRVLSSVNNVLAMIRMAIICQVTTAVLCNQAPFIQRKEIQ